MDLDEKWCRMYFPIEQPQELDTVIALVRGKRSRISEFSINTVSCFVVSEDSTFFYFCSSTLSTFHNATNVLVIVAF